LGKKPALKCLRYWVGDRKNLGGGPDKTSHTTQQDPQNKGDDTIVENRSSLGRGVLLHLSEKKTGRLL